MFVACKLYKNNSSEMGIVTITSSVDCATKIVWLVEYGLQFWLHNQWKAEDLFFGCLFLKLQRNQTHQHNGSQVPFNVS